MDPDEHDQSSRRTAKFLCAMRFDHGPNMEKLFRGLHQGQRLSEPHQQAKCTTELANIEPSPKFPWRRIGHLRANKGHVPDGGEKLVVSHASFRRQHWLITRSTGAKPDQ